MRKLLYALPFAVLPLLFGCEPSVEQAQKDLEQTKQNAQENVKDAVRDADKTITEEQRKVADTAKAEADKIERSGAIWKMRRRPKRSASILKPSL